MPARPDKCKSKGSRPGQAAGSINDRRRSSYTANLGALSGWRRANERITPFPPRWRAPFSVPDPSRSGLRQRVRCGGTPFRKSDGVDCGLSRRRRQTPPCPAGVRTAPVSPGELERFLGAKLISVFGADKVAVSHRGLLIRSGHPLDATSGRSCSLRCSTARVERALLESARTPSFRSVASGWMTQACFRLSPTRSKPASLTRRKNPLGVVAFLRIFIAAISSSVWRDIGIDGVRVCPQGRRHSFLGIRI